MGTIIARRRKDGTTGYTAKIRLKRDGKIVHAETETFNTRVLAKEWMTRREATLQGQRARGEAVGDRMSVAEMVEWYEGRERPEEPWGRTKKADLAALRTGDLGPKRVDRLTKQDFIEQIERRRKDGAGPATAGNDLIWLRGVFKSAAAVLGVPVPLAELNEAAEYLRGERLIGKPNQRDRRLHLERKDRPGEEQRILAYFETVYRGSIPMSDIVQFALLTARREEEITRLLRSDLDPESKTALLRDVKHPRKKIGNHKRFRMLDEAWVIVARQPEKIIVGTDGKKTTDPRIFPFNAKTIGANFTRAMHFLEIEGLCFHDLRHEATSRLFERGYSIQEVAQFTLHESWATLKRYTHLKPENVPDR